MEEVFNEIEEPFGGLTTEYQQNTYFLNHFNLVVRKDIYVSNMTTVLAKGDLS